MWRKALVIGWSVLAITGAALFTLAQDQAPAEQKAAPAMSAEMMASMEAMKKAAMVGENHAFLARLAGSWTCEVTAWMGPGKPERSKGSCENAMVLGGRFLRQVYESTFMNEPFNGIGYTGYDNVLHAFTGTWMDTMGTGIATSVGTLDESGKVLDSTMSYPDPVTKKVKESRFVLRVLDKDHYVEEMYETTKEGKEFMIMEVRFTRKR